MERSNSGAGAFARKRREREEREPALTSDGPEALEVPTPLEPEAQPVPVAVPEPIRTPLERATTTTVETRDEDMSEPRLTPERAREIASQIVKGVATTAGCCLIVAALLIAVKANPNNSLVWLIRHLAQFLDLGFFSLSNPIKQVTGPHGPALTALLNYGIGSVVWFVLGGLVATLVKGKGSSR